MVARITKLWSEGADAQSRLELTLSDEALVARVLEGDREAFGVLVVRYREPFLRRARGLVRDEAEAEDVVQTALMNMYEKLHTFQTGSNFRSWAYRVVTNCGLMRLRRKRVRQETGLDQVHPNSLSDDRTFELDVAPCWRQRPDTQLERVEAVSALSIAVEALPELYREVFMLRERDDLSLLEIGALLGLSIPAVKSRLHRARLHLREQLVADLAA